MTGFYESFGVVDRLSVKCPECGKEATFNYAQVIRLEKKADASLFDQQWFVAKTFKTEYSKWPGMLFFPRPNAVCSWQEKCPEKYRHASSWPHMANASGTDGVDLGYLYCPQCHFAAKHVLNWPADAYYTIQYRDHVLWAFNRDMMVEIRNYIHAPTRSDLYPVEPVIIRHLPTFFKRAKNRDTLVKKLDKLLLQ